MNNAFDDLDIDHRFAQLPECFYTNTTPEGVAKDPNLLIYNPAIAKIIGLDPSIFEQQSAADIFSGNTPFPRGHSVSMVYSGHQFGHWAGQLGDGRAHLIAQIRDNQHQLWDLQLKGSGITPYSRMGDGRAVLRSSIREYLASIAMHGLGIPTTHALCLVATGSAVQREKIEPGAVLTRLARSHLRFGHFEHFAHHNMNDQIPILLQHLLENYFPTLSAEEYLFELIKRTAHLIADWQTVGFAHGVMNTDNMSLLGLTIDYGPYGFMEKFDLGLVCNHSDYQGRYRFDRQPEIGQWNLCALMAALETVIPWDQSKELMKHYPQIFMEHYHQNMMMKLGLSPQNHDRSLWQNLLSLLQESQSDYTLAFHAIADWLSDPKTPLPFIQANGAQKWLIEYRQLCQQTQDIKTVSQKIRQKTPRYILRNWLAEVAIRNVEENNDLRALKRLSTILANPFEEHPESHPWQQPAPAEYANLRLSCSS